MAWWGWLLCGLVLLAGLGAGYLVACYQIGKSFFR